MVKKLLRVVGISAFLIVLTAILYLQFSKLNIFPHADAQTSFVQTTCDTLNATGPNWGPNNQPVKCKPGWLNGASHLMWQLDSGGGSCPGGFQCGSGACFSCSVYNDCAAQGIGQYDSNKPTCLSIPTSTPGSTTSYPIVTPTLKGEGASCYYGYECQSGICNGAWNQLTGRVIGDNPPSYPGTCAPANTPTPTSTCSGTTGRVNGCTCTANTQCQSNFCDLSNSEYTGTNKCKTLAPTPTILITPTLTPQQWCATHPSDAMCLTPTVTPHILSCDANKDGVTNDADYDWWYQEFTGQKTTIQADCNNDGVVDVVDFSIWRDIAVLHLIY